VRELAGGGGGALALQLQIQQALVDLASERDQARQVLQLLADAEVVGVVEGGLSTKSAAELEVLLDAGVPVTDLEAGVDALGEDAGARGLAPGPLGTAAEDELDLVGAAEVEVLADHLLEEQAAVQGAVEDPGVGDLKLQDGELVGEPGGTVLGAEGAGQIAQPAVEEALDVLGPEAAAEAAVTKSRVIFPSNS
jgi:hypothetical protein